MKRIILLSLAAGLALGAGAQNKLDAGSRARLRAGNAPVEFIKDGKHGAAKARQRAHAAEKSIRAFVTVADPEAAKEALMAAGANVTGGRGNMLMVEFPETALEAIEAIPEVKSIRMERPVSAKLDIAREVSGIDKIHSGLDLPQSYTGKGVVCGIVDGGFDPNHINFLDENGRTRVAQITNFRATSSGQVFQDIYTGDKIATFETDDAGTFHGTHTTGIMAGGYRGMAKVAFPTKNHLGEIKETANPYYGVAYGSDIAMAAGSLSDYFIAMGIEDILNYAWEEQKPSVINLSLGSNVGPHDGSSIICQYLDMASEMDRVVFCVSAGNEGDLPIAMNKTLSEESTTLQTLLEPTTAMPNYPNLRYAQVYIYSSDSRPFEVQVVAVNMNRNGNTAWRGSLSGAEDGNTQSKYWVSSSSYQGSDGDIVDPQFGKWFEGYIGIASELDTQNNRSYAVVDCMCWDNPTNNPEGRYVIGFLVKGAPGQRIDVFCDGAFNNLSNYGLANFENGSTDGTISDVACGHNYVVVGSYNTRDEWASMDGGIYGYQNLFKYGAISDFSSYGTLYDGRTLPTVVAPGATVISSSNEYYLDYYRAGDDERQATVESNGRKYSWHQCVGTSMSTPLVTGSIALWMEADPTLDYKAVLDIIKKTAVRDEAVENHAIPVQAGAGKFDAYAGLKEVLARAGAGVGNVIADAGRKPAVTATGHRSFKVTLDGSEDFTATLFNVSGTVAGKYRSVDGEAHIDASAMQPGVYLLQVDGSGAPAVRVLVK
ncbi:MAG: S8 family peptidase [Muribaculaceae bacterium]|nr:S8 family peptidase [Muribaculaceae bacterium]